MIGYMPTFYEECREMMAIVETEGEELDQLRSAIDEVLDQFFVDTSTWGLDIWEKELSITVDLNKPLAERRSVVKSKLRGTGTVTFELLKNVAESYDNGAIEVSDTPGEYSIEIKFVDTLGLPTNLDDLKDAIEEVKPAHLAVTYTFRYLTIDEVDQTLTIDQIESRALTEFAPFLE
jgi:hypothetical protein